MNMKRNKESGEEEGGGGEISTDAGSQASNPCFGASRSLVVPLTPPHGWTVSCWSLYFTTVFALPELPRRGVGAPVSRRRGHGVVVPMLSWWKIGFFPFVKVET